MVNYYITHTTNKLKGIVRFFLKKYYHGPCQVFVELSVKTQGIGPHDDPFKTNKIGVAVTETRECQWPWKLESARKDSPKRSENHRPLG